MLAKLLKRIEYYWERRKINRHFKKRESQIVYGTFLRSFCDMRGAMHEASTRYGRIVELRYWDLKHLNAEYQCYFDRDLEITPPPE